jgi:hypothetical protein
VHATKTTKRIGTNGTRSEKDYGGREKALHPTTQGQLE